MFINDNSIQNIRQLVKELKAYVEMQKEHARLELTEKLTILFSTMIFAMILIVLGMAILFCLSFSLAHLLAPYVGLPASYIIIAGVILLLAIFVAAFRKKLIVNPLANFLAHLFLNNHSK